MGQPKNFTNGPKSIAFSVREVATDFYGYHSLGFVYSMFIESFWVFWSLVWYLHVAKRLLVLISCQHWSKKSKYVHGAVSLHYGSSISINKFAMFLITWGIRHLIIILTSLSNLNYNLCILYLKVWSCPFGRFDPSPSNVDNLSMPLS